MRKRQNTKKTRKTRQKDKRKEREREIYLDICERLKTQDILLFCANRQGKKEFKHSYHVLWKDQIFHCGLDVETFVSQSLPNLYDKSVYKKEGRQQLFRLPYTPKGGEGNESILKEVTNIGNGL